MHQKAINRKRFKKKAAGETAANIKEHLAYASGITGSTSFFNFSRLSCQPK
jgi:hypothetical protein